MRCHRFEGFEFLVAKYSASAQGETVHVTSQSCRRWEKRGFLFPFGTCARLCTICLVNKIQQLIDNPLLSQTLIIHRGLCEGFFM